MAHVGDGAGRVAGKVALITGMQLKVEAGGLLASTTSGVPG
jgi:hypothetical protein